MVFRRLTAMTMFWGVVVSASVSGAADLKIEAGGNEYRMCGRLSKPSGTAKDWKISGCKALLDLVMEEQCDNNLPDEGEFCYEHGKTDTGNCKSPARCDRCRACVTPTPAPVETPLPSPPPVPVDVDLSDCEPAPGGGSFVPLYPGFKDSFGYPRVQINPGEKQTYCFKIEDDRPRFSISLIDRTGVAQCFSHRAIYYPPPGSGLPTVPSGNGWPPGAAWFTDPKGGWGNQSSTMWAKRNWLAPKGVYKVTLEMDPLFPASCGVFELYTG
jgi:hypothetical protein